MRQHPRDEEQHLLREGRVTNSQLCGKVHEDDGCLLGSASISRGERPERTEDASLGVGGASK